MDSDRAALVRQALHQHGYQALVCRLPEHVVMLTGYQPVLGNTFCLVSLVDDSVEVRLVAPGDEDDRMPRDSAVEIRTYVEETLDVINTTVPAAREALAEVVASAGIGKGAAVAFEGDRSPVAPAYTQVGFPGVSSVDLLRDVLPDADLRPATGMFEELASVKTAAELECIRRAERAAFAGFQAARAAIQPGATEADVAGAAQSAILRAGYASAPGGHVLAHVHVMAGARAANAYKAYNLTSGNRIARGATVLVQMEVSIDGYWVELTRTFFAGSVDETWIRAHDACARAQDAALAVIREGISGREVDEAARSVLRDAGLGKEFRHGLGHGFGFQAINHAAEPVLHPVSRSILRAGMAHNMEPAVYRSGVGGFRLNDDVVVRVDGCDVLSDGLPRTLDWLVVDW